MLASLQMTQRFRGVSLTINTAFVCDHPGCARTFNVKSNMRRHQKTHHDIRTTHSSRYSRFSPFSGSSHSSLSSYNSASSNPPSPFTAAVSPHIPLRRP